MINNLEFNVWGRDFSLQVEYDCYEGETVSPEQEDAIKAFMSHSEWIEEAKHTVENYCKEAVLADCENQKKDNIFSYIKPEAVFIKRDKTKPRVALMCKYRYDPEHGLAVVFDTNGKVTVGAQDIIL